MSKFKFMEYAIGNTSNRNKYATIKEVINKPFENGNRYNEYWRSMYAYETNTPKESDTMFGNFYIESDNEDFNENKDIIITISDYLHNNYNIPYSYFDYFITNRSIWLSLPSKVFGCFGSKKLNEIYREMAIQINKYLNSNKYIKTLDLSIYKWNGLVHSLGSYLPKTKRWVTKFTYLDLVDCYVLDDLLKAKYDNCFGYSDVQVIDSAKEWFDDCKKIVFNTNKTNCTSNNCKMCSNRLCMQKLEERGTIDENRNLHIYTYSLYLKEKGYKLNEAILKVETIFNNAYVKSKECHKTIQSAINGKKKFNCRIVKELLDNDLFICNECDLNTNKTTFIVPRVFISMLNAVKAHYKVYKILLKILYAQQIENKNFILNLKGDKYKKDTISYFELLQTLNIIKYEIHNDIISTNLIYIEKNNYKSHIVIQKNFLQSNIFNKLKFEFKVLMELLRCSLYKNNVLFFNINIKTLIKNLHSSYKSINKYINILKRLKLLFDRFLFVFSSKNEIKRRIGEIVNKIKRKIKTKETELLCINKKLNEKIKDTYKRLIIKYLNKDLIYLESNNN